MKIEITKAELKALLLMASEVAEHEDVMLQTFPNGKRRATAYNVYNRLWSMVRSATIDRSKA